MLTGSDLLLMGFPQCGSSYYLLMQLDKDFRPFFNLLESQAEPHGKSHSDSEASYVFRLNKIDINQMQMVEDESNLALVDWKELQSLPNTRASNAASEQNLPSDYGLESNLQPAGRSQLSFSSIVDEVFESEKVKPGPTFSIQSQPSSPFNAASFTHVSALSTTHHGMKAGTNMHKLDGGLQHSQISNYAKISTAGSGLNSSLYGANSLKNVFSTNSFSSPSPGRNSPVQKLSLSKSDQDLSSLRSLGEVGQYSIVDGDQVRSASDSSKDVSALVRASRSTQPSSPLRGSGFQVKSMKPNGLKGMSGSLIGISICETCPKLNSQ